MISWIRHKAGSFKYLISYFMVIILKFLKFFGVWHNFFLKKNCQRFLILTDRAALHEKFSVPILKNLINRTRSCPLSLIAPHIFPRGNSPMLPTQDFRLCDNPPPPPPEKILHFFLNHKNLYWFSEISTINFRCPHFLNLFEMCISLSINSVYFKLKLFDLTKILVWNI